MQYMTDKELIAKLEAELAAMPKLAEIHAMRPRTLDEEIARVQLRGKRAALERLLAARKGGVGRA